MHEEFPRISTLDDFRNVEIHFRMATILQSVLVASQVPQIPS